MRHHGRKYKERKLSKTESLKIGFEPSMVSLEADPSYKRRVPKDLKSAWTTTKVTQNPASEYTNHTKIKDPTRIQIKEWNPTKWANPTTQKTPPKPQNPHQMRGSEDLYYSVADLHNNPIMHKSQPKDPSMSSSLLAPIRTKRGKKHRIAGRSINNEEYIYKEEELRSKPGPYPITRTRPRTSPYGGIIGDGVGDCLSTGNINKTINITKNTTGIYKSGYIYIQNTNMNIPPNIPHNIPNTQNMSTCERCNKRSFKYENLELGESNKKYRGNKHKYKYKTQSLNTSKYLEEEPSSLLTYTPYTITINKSKNNITLITPKQSIIQESEIIGDEDITTIDIPKEHEIEKSILDLESECDHTLAPKNLDELDDLDDDSALKDLNNDTHNNNNENINLRPDSTDTVHIYSPQTHNYTLCGCNRGNKVVYLCKTEITGICEDCLANHLFHNHDVVEISEMEQVVKQELEFVISRLGLIKGEDGESLPTADIANLQTISLEGQDVGYVIDKLEYIQMVKEKFGIEEVLREKPTSEVYLQTDRDSEPERPHDKSTQCLGALSDDSEHLKLSLTQALPTNGLDELQDNFTFADDITINEENEYEKIIRVGRWLTRTMGEYNLSNKTWKGLPIRNLQKPIPVFSQSIYINTNSVLIIGGLEDLVPNKPKFTSQLLSIEYRNGEYISRKLADMKHRRAAFGAIYIYMDSVYVMGGVDQRTYLSDSERYNISTNKWSNLHEMPTPLKGVCLVHFQHTKVLTDTNNIYTDSYIYAFGGVLPTHKLSKYIYKYIVKTDMWEEVAVQLQYGLVYASALQTTHDQILITGGSYLESRGATNSKVFMFNGSTGRSISVVGELSEGILTSYPPFFVEDALYFVNDNMKKEYPSVIRYEINSNKYNM